MLDWIFAFGHLILLLGVAGYAIYGLVAGNRIRGGLILVALVVYYFIILHPAAKKEIARKKEKRAKR